MILQLAQLRFISYQGSIENRDFKILLLHFSNARKFGLSCSLAIAIAEYWVKPLFTMMGTPWRTWLKVFSFILFHLAAGLSINTWVIFNFKMAFLCFVFFLWRRTLKYQEIRSFNSNSLCSPYELNDWNLYQGVHDFTVRMPPGIVELMAPTSSSRSSFTEKTVKLVSRSQYHLGITFSLSVITKEFRHRDQLFLYVNCFLV